jgi:hypothetical protein
MEAPSLFNKIIQRNAHLATFLKPSCHSSRFCVKPPSRPRLRIRLSSLASSLQTTLTPQLRPCQGKGNGGSQGKPSRRFVFASRGQGQEHNLLVIWPAKNSACVTLALAERYAKARVVRKELQPSILLSSNLGGSGGLARRTNPEIPEESYYEIPHFA